MKRTLWKWAGPVGLLAVIGVFSWAQERSTGQNDPLQTEPLRKPLAESTESRLPPGEPDSAPVRRPDDTSEIIEEEAIDPRLESTRSVTAETHHLQSVTTDYYIRQPDGTMKKVSVRGLPNRPGQKGLTVHPGSIYGGSVEDFPGMAGASTSASLGEPMRVKLVPRTVYESQMVPISESELRDMQSYQVTLQTLRNENLSEDTKADSRVMLAKFVALQFDRDLESREKDVVELEARVKKLREQLDKRKAAREKIIELRMTTIQNEIDGLGFPGGAAGMAPGGGFADPAYLPSTIDNPNGPGGLQPVPDLNSDAPSYSRPDAPADSPPIRRPVSRDEFKREEKSRLPGSSRTRPMLDDEPELNDSFSFKRVPVDPSNDAAGSVPVAATNLILNGDFEMFNRQEDRAEGWDNLVPQGSEHKRVAGQGIDGSAAFLIRNAESFGNTLSTVSQEIPYTGNSLIIRFSAQVKCKADKRAVMQIGFINEQDMLQSVEPLMFLKHDSDQWVRYECEGRIPKGTKKIVYSLGNHGPGDVWLDALTAHFFEDSTTENLLQNPSMEALDGGPQGDTLYWKRGQQIPGVVYNIDRGHTGDVNDPTIASLSIRKTENRYFPIAEFTQTINYTGHAPAIQLSAMVKTENATKAILDVLFLDDKGEWIEHEWAAYIGDQNAEPKPLTHDWKEYTGAVAIPAGTKQIVIGLQDYGPGSVWFDDVSAVYLKELPKEPNNVPK